MTSLEDVAFSTIVCWPRGTQPGDGWKPAEPGSLQVGDIVAVHSRGNWRQVVVEKVGPKRVGILYTTEGAVKDSERVFPMHVNVTDAEIERTAQGRSKYAEGTYDRLAKDSAEGRNVDYFAKWSEGLDRATLTQKRYDDTVASMTERRERGRRLGPRRAFVNFTRKSVKYEDVLVGGQQA